MRSNTAHTLELLNLTLMDFFEDQEQELLLLAQALHAAFAVDQHVYIFGNGGSAAQAQHFAAEMVGRFFSDARNPLPVTALTTDTSILTAVANDFSFDSVFSRQLDALGNSGDVAFALSTSGNSKNIIQALEMASDIGMLTVAMTGLNGIPPHTTHCDFLFKVPSTIPSVIQEVHLVALHVLAFELEQYSLGLRKVVP